MTAAGRKPAAAYPPLPQPRRLPAVRAPLLRVLPGTADAVSTARRLALELLGPGDPAVDTVMLVISELVTNAIVHTASGAPGGSLTLALCPGPAGVLVQVRDDGSPTTPSLAAPGPVSAPDAAVEHGYGLVLVNALADSWGTLPSPDGRITWCRIATNQRDRGGRGGLGS